MTPNNLLIACILLTWVILGGWLFVRLWRERSGENMLEGFMRRFPGRCPICAYHRYGIREGHVKPGTPVPEHEGCLEKRCIGS